MIFQYDESKGYVRGDFNRFVNMGFNDKQIFPAILDEYTNGEEFCRTEEVCICIFVCCLYLECDMDVKYVRHTLINLLQKVDMQAIEVELRDDYKHFVIDLNYIVEIK